MFCRTEESHSALQTSILIVHGTFKIRFLMALRATTALPPDVLADAAASALRTVIALPPVLLAKATASALLANTAPPSVLSAHRRCSLRTPCTYCAAFRAHIWFAYVIPRPRMIWFASVILRPDQDNCDTLSARCPLRGRQ